MASHADTATPTATPTATQATTTSDRIVAKYLVESAHPLERAVAIIAGEQSTGTFVRLPGETEELTRNHAARIESIESLGDREVPGLPHAQVPGGSASDRGASPRYNRGIATLSFPLANMGPSLPNLVATVMGNLYELRELSGLRLLDLELPPAFREAYPGPAFGIDGTRRLAGVVDRPILGTIIKPSVGLSAAQTASLVRSLCEAGIDFVKDDELQANGPHNPLEDRVRAVMAVIDDHAARSGKKVMYAFNVTGEVDHMLRAHDTVLAAGGTCIMASLNSVGLPALAHLRRHSQLPIHGHRNGWGMLTRCPDLGIEFVAYQKLWRLAGVDHLHCNGLRNKFWEPDASVLKSARALLSPFIGTIPVMPVLSSAQWAGQIPETYEALQTPDFMYLCGGGIFGHPSGAAAGLASLHQAWEAARLGIPLATHAATHAELRGALETFA